MPSIKGNDRWPWRSPRQRSCCWAAALPYRGNIWSNLIWGNEGEDWRSKAQAPRDKAVLLGGLKTASLTSLTQPKISLDANISKFLQDLAIQCHAGLQIRQWVFSLPALQRRVWPETSWGSTAVPSHPPAHNHNHNFCAWSERPVPRHRSGSRRVTDAHLLLYLVCPASTPCHSRGSSHWCCSSYQDTNLDAYILVGRRLQGSCSITWLLVLTCTCRLMDRQLSQIAVVS